MSRSLFEPKARESTRSSLEEQFGSDGEQIQRVDLGLYGTPADMYHILKSSYLDLSKLRSAGFFEAHWQGRVVGAWEDLSGRIVNLWSWTPSGIRSDGPAPRGDILFERDSLGSQKTPFLLKAALAGSVVDLIHFDDPVHAIGARLSGLQDPFPIASQGRLVAEQVDVLERALGGRGSFKLLPSYEPRKKRQSGRFSVRDEKLLGRATFPTYLIDPKLMARSRAEPMGPEQFIRQNGLHTFAELLLQSEMLATPVEASGSWGLGKAFGGLSGKRATKTRSAASAKNPSADQVPALLSMILKAAEEIGSRIAQGFLKAMPGHTLNAPPPTAAPQLNQVGHESSDKQLDTGDPQPESQLARTTRVGLLPAAPEAPPRSFSVDRLERQSLGSALAKSTGWKAVDEMEVRFRPGELTVVGAESGHGRTTFLVGLLLHWLFTTREEFVYYSFDKSETQIYHRLLSLVTAAHGIGWSLTRVRNRFSSRKDQGTDPDDRDFDSLAASREFLRNREKRFRLVYRPSTEPDHILAELEPLARDGNLGAVFIDPLDGLRADAKSHRSLGTQLKSVAVKLNCPVIALSRTT